METRIVKIEKGCFWVLYREGPFSTWEIVEKEFKTQTKAKEYIIKHFG